MPERYHKSVHYFSSTDTMRQLVKLLARRFNTNRMGRVSCSL